MKEKGCEWMTDRIVSMNWVRDHLHHSDVVLADCRFILGQSNGKASLKEYLPSAVYFDLEKDLSASVQKHGGRHPLPEISTLVQTIQNAGINANTHVIAYDDQDGAMASRLWWLLTYVGHKKVSVMDGNFSEWKKLGYPVTNETCERKPSTFVPLLQPQMLVSMEEVKQKLTHPDAVIIDSREEKRYLGETEPIDSVAGHIPNALHSFWKDAKDENGRFRSSKQLQEHFKKIPSAKEIIVYCGSGITATPNVLALQEAGFENVKLYAGSWSDWISYPDNPVAKGKEN
jgi:thiosulfate/3-mercaptopyruvate sulfurtransferase